MQRREDKWLLPMMIGAIVGATALAFVVGLFLHLQWTLLPLGVVLGALLAVIIFGAACSATSTARPRASPARRRGRWTTCAAGGS